jgi:hypothetical protein
MADEQATEWKPEAKLEADIVPEATQVTDNRGFDLGTDKSPADPTSFVTYTFYCHSVSAGTGKGIPITIVADRSSTILYIYMQVETAPGLGKILLVDVNKNGTTIFTDQNQRPAILDTDTTGMSGTPAITTLIKDDELTMDIDTNDGTPAKLSVYVRCQA